MHENFAQHVTAERMTRAFTEKAGAFEIWRPIPNRENHWLDTTAGCCLAAAIRGCSLEKKRKRKVNQHDNDDDNETKKQEPRKGWKRGGGGFATSY